VQMVSRVLHATGCDPGALELEITESVVMENPEDTAVTLRQLSNMGIGLSIDDFGTGYSSLSYLKKFPIDALKIDRSFVMDITHDLDDATIVKAVIALAHSLNLKVTAEGVETEDQLNFLHRQKCDFLQGFLFSKPISADDLEKIIAQQERRN
jgi:EAL domain-containing protein (putative c-di-GMP-specific phosphodiesterase class I)